MMYIKQIVEFLDPEWIKYPMKMHVDNSGAICLTNNEAGGRTKHVDVRYHFVRDLVSGEEPLLKIDYVNTEWNKADIFNKNVSTSLFERHTRRYWSLEEGSGEEKTKDYVNESLERK
eukprot:scaffold9710_cov97-Amphora_coffeaeformis.AAC.1